MSPGNCSGSYSEPPRARAIALRSSSCPREVDATTFSIRTLAMGTPSGPGSRIPAPVEAPARNRCLIYFRPPRTSPEDRTDFARDGRAAESRDPADPSRLDALHAAVCLRPPQQAQERLGLRPVEGDHVPAPVRRPGLPVLDDAQDAVPGLLPHRHELRHLRGGPRVLEGPLEHGEAAVRDDGDLVRHLVQEAAVVAHDEQHAGIRPQGGRHDLLALDVEVVRRLVEDEEVVVLGDELREGEARPLAAAELPDPAVDRVPPEPEAAAVGLRDALEAHDPRAGSARAEGEAEGPRGRRRRLRRLAPHRLDPELAREHLLVHLAGLERLDDRELALQLLPVS